VKEGRRQKAGDRRNIAYTVSFLTFFNWIVISATLDLATNETKIILPIY